MSLKAFTSFVENIARLTSSDDHDRSLEQIWLSEASTNRQNLTGCESLLVLVRVVQKLGIKVARSEEVDVHSNTRLNTNISGGVLVLQALNLRHGDEVSTDGEVVEKSGCVAESLEDDGLCEFRVLLGEAVG